MYMNEELDQKQIIFLIIIMIVFIIVAIVMYSVTNGKKYDRVKIDSKANYVYEKEGEYSLKDRHLPYINIEGETAERYNDEISQLEEEIVLHPDSRVGFVFNKSNQILSVCIKIIRYDTEDERPEVSFRTYLLNLETLEEYSLEDIYEDYGIDKISISASIKRGFETMYQEVVKEKYVDPNECDYDCFLEWRGVRDYLDGAMLYIENKKLIAFRGFQTESVFGEENYFKSEHFKFEVQR